jgi:hypothetical protein
MSICSLDFREAMVYGLGMKLVAAPYTHQDKLYFILKVREFINGHECYMIDESGKFFIANLDEVETEKIKATPTVTFDLVESGL